ncbi:hypothetical protein NMY22_g13563 [Coprinellus aureogranulatus]|nr:hypothetical protein NMY22_g13563 [Coprinellus aureogranulatus]
MVSAVANHKHDMYTEGHMSCFALAAIRRRRIAVLGNGSGSRSKHGLPSTVEIKARLTCKLSTSQLYCYHEIGSKRNRMPSEPFCGN